MIWILLYFSIFWKIIKVKPGPCGSQRKHSTHIVFQGKSQNLIFTKKWGETSHFYDMISDNKITPNPLCFFHLLWCTLDYRGWETHFLSTPEWHWHGGLGVPTYSLVSVTGGESWPGNEQEWVFQGLTSQRDWWQGRTKAKKQKSQITSGTLQSLSWLTSLTTPSSHFDFQPHGASVIF